MKKKIVAFTLAMVFAFASVVSVQAQETKEWIDPAEAAKVLDYQIQGEYVGDFIEDYITNRNDTNLNFKNIHLGQSTII